MKRRCKENFPKDERGRAILASVEDMAEWVDLGFEEQKLSNSNETEILDTFIDLRNCLLYISYPIGSNDVASKIFNFCDLAGVVPYIHRDENIKNDYHYIVEKDIRFDGSELLGGGFHYVWFKGKVVFKNSSVSHCSFATCRFDGTLNMYYSAFGRLSIDRCHFHDYLSISNIVIQNNNIEFRNCKFKQDVRISNLCLVTSGRAGINDQMGFVKCCFERVVEFSKVKLSNNELLFMKCQMNGIKFKDLSCENSNISMIECTLDGVSLIEKSSNVGCVVNEFVLWSVRLLGQLHFEDCEINQFQLAFSEIAQQSRIRFYNTKISNLRVQETSIDGRYDIEKSQISNIDYSGSICTGVMTFYQSCYNQLENLPTIRLMKVQALKLNDISAYLKLYHQEMDIYEKELSWKIPDKFVLRLNRISNNYDQSWIRGVIFTLLIAFLILVIVNLFGRVSGIPSFDFSHSGFRSFVNDYLSILNVFNIMYLEDGTLDLNGVGLVLVFFAKIFILYGGYQTIIAFRKISQKSNTYI